jgi:hypothetical protein
MSDKLKIAICTPVYNNVDFDVYFNHMYCISRWSNDYKLCFTGRRGTSPVLACEKMAEFAIGVGYQYAFYLDADHIMPAETLDCLSQGIKDAAMISGLVCKRRGDYQQVWWVKEENSDTYKYTDFNLDGKRYEVDICAFGCTLINLEKLQKLEKPWFRVTLENGNTVWSDVNLCKAFRAKEEKIYVDTRVLVGHHGMNSVVYPQSANLLRSRSLVESEEHLLREGQTGFYLTPGNVKEI